MNLKKFTQENLPANRRASLKCCWMCDDIIIKMICTNFLLVKQGTKTQASRTQPVYHMQTLQWLFDQANYDHRMSSHM